jgi:alanine racemase
MARSTLATIHIERLQANFQALRALAAGSKLLAVVKAEAYGHGLETVACSLPEADCFGLVTLRDGERLRAAGVRQPLLLMPGFDEPSDFAALDDLKLDAVIHSTAQLELMLRFPKLCTFRPWLKLNSGMNRLGLPLAELPRALAILDQLPLAGPPIMMTHFANADGAAEDRPTPTEQMAAFFAAVEGYDYELSLANSAATLMLPAARRHWVRVGGALYGLSTVPGKVGADFGMQPVMSLHAKLIAIQDLAAGARVGYGGAFVAPHAMRIGVVSIGYGDGYPRRAPNGTPVKVRGQFSQLVGRVSMDLCTIDLTHIHAEVGDQVLLWGDDLPVERVAERADTIGYELTCGLTYRVEHRSVEHSLPIEMSAHG